jgi:hypothetical protein
VAHCPYGHKTNNKSEVSVGVQDTLGPYLESLLASTEGESVFVRMFLNEPYECVLHSAGQCISICVANVAYTADVLMDVV